MQSLSQHLKQILKRYCSFSFLHTVHLVAFHKALILLVNSGGSSGEGPNVFIQIPAQVLIKDCGHEVELFVIVFLHKEKTDHRGGICLNRQIRS